MTRAFWCQYALENKAGIPECDAWHWYTVLPVYRRATPQGSLRIAGIPACDVLRVKLIKYNNGSETQPYCSISYYTCHPFFVNKRLLALASAGTQMLCICIPSLSFVQISEHKIEPLLKYFQQTTYSRWKKVHAQLTKHSKIGNFQFFWPVWSNGIGYSKTLIITTTELQHLHMNQSSYAYIFASIHWPLARQIGQMMERRWEVATPCGNTQRCRVLAESCQVPCRRRSEHGRYAKWQNCSSMKYRVNSCCSQFCYGN